MFCLISSYFKRPWLELASFSRHFSDLRHLLLAEYFNIPELRDATSYSD